MRRSYLPEGMDPLDELIIANPKKELKIKPCARCKKPMEYSSNSKRICWDCIQERKRKRLLKIRFKLTAKERYAANRKVALLKRKEQISGTDVK